MVTTNLGTEHVLIKNNLNYQKKQKLAYPEKMQQHGRWLLHYHAYRVIVRKVFLFQMLGKTFRIYIANQSATLTKMSK